MKKKKKNYLEKQKKILDKIKFYSKLAVFLILLLFFFNIFDFKTNLIILLFSLTIIIILYYNQKIRMIEYKMKNKFQTPPPHPSLKNKEHKEHAVENFEFNVIENEKLDKEKNISCKPSTGARINYHCSSKDSKSPYDPINNSVINNLYSDLATNESVYWNENVFTNNKKQYNPNFLTKTDNNKLVGAPNPKTLVPPIIAPRSLDLHYWSMTNEFNQDIINHEKKRYDDESGYIVKAENESGHSYNLDLTPNDYHLRPVKIKRKSETKQPNYTFKKLLNNRYKTLEEFSSDSIHEKNNNYSEHFQMDINRDNRGNDRGSSSQENFQSEKNVDNKYAELNDDEYQLFNKEFKTNRYFKDKYNPNLLTNTVTPGVYHINDRNEPINSLMGISHEQQFQQSSFEDVEPFESVNMSNTYDPRFYGHGTSYRSYIDENVGQPRFYYDDINAIKMPNYITRNAIDVTSFGDSYGPLNGGNKYTQDIHKLADQEYMNATTNFRNEMMQRLMRKRNSESWQQRTFPIRTGGQRMLK
jgi:hypothetical protein